MSITIGSQKRSITKIKAQYIAAACGIALAASAIVAIASWPGDSGDKAGAGFTPLISAASSQSANAQPWVYFVVGSQDEAFQLEGMLASDSYAQETPVTSHILVVNTIEQEMQLVATVEELMIAGVDFQLADLRSQPPAPVMPAAAEQSVANAQLEADIMASVISTERAAYVFDTTPAAALQASEADVRASVVSTERATWALDASSVPMFGTAADAEFAARGLVPEVEIIRPQPVAPMFGTAADAEYAGRSLMP